MIFSPMTNIHLSSLFFFIVGDGGRRERSEQLG
jgi:hypothetical protein